MLWVRMLAQVLDTSVYAFSAILVVVLIALGLGSLLAAWLSGIVARPGIVLPALLALTGLAILAQPFVFVALTNGLAPLGMAPGQGGEIGPAIRFAAATRLPAGALAGTVFPYLLRVAQPAATSAGPAIGTLTSLNTLGAIADSLATGFVVLPRAGLWPSFTWFGGAYLARAWLSSRAPAGARAASPVPAGYGAAAAIAWRRTLRLGVAGAIALSPPLLVDVTALPLVWLDPARGECLVAAWHGGHGIVTVVESPRKRALRLDNAYSLGGTLDGLERERIQARVPLLVHPRPLSVFFLGLGAGVTAGEAVRHPLSRIVVSELVPEVVEAARGFFAREANRLFDDPRVEVTVEDGRQVLARRGERFDVIVGDLFVPWHAGTGSLYTREHFEAVRQRLTPGGLFVQWLPLYQLAEREFQVIARTRLAVYAAIVHRLQGEDGRARRALERALSALPEDLPVAGPFMSLTLLAPPGSEAHAARPDVPD